MKNLIGSVFGLVCFSLLMVSCDITVDLDYAAFVTERDLWEATQPQNYQYHLEDWNNGYSIPIQALIKVENGQFKEQVIDPDYLYLEDDYEYVLDDYLSTISGIYSSIEKEYNAYNHSKKPMYDVYLTAMEIEYDKVNHIPLKITKHYYVPMGLMDAASKSITEIKDFEIIN